MGSTSIWENGILAGRILRGRQCLVRRAPVRWEKYDCGIHCERSGQLEQTEQSHVQAEMLSATSFHLKCTRSFSRILSQYCITWANVGHG